MDYLDYPGSPNENFDTTATVSLDNNGDGVVDEVRTLHRNYSDNFYGWLYGGVPDEMAFYNPMTLEQVIDTNGDGIADLQVTTQYGPMMNETSRIEQNDYDQDGNIDMVKEYADTNGDGAFDTVQVTHITEEGAKIDTYADTDGDGRPDQTSSEFIPAGTVPGLIDYGNYDTANADDTDGSPADDMANWEFQGDTNRCALYAQKFTIEAITGQEIDIEEMEAIAEQNGWFNNGTATLDMSKMLEYYGVESDMTFGNDIDALRQALEDGKKVIVGLDSNQVWFGSEGNILDPSNAANHAVQVIGIDNSNPDCPMVVLNDSGSPQGCGELVPVEIFKEAWLAGDCQMITC